MYLWGVDTKLSYQVVKYSLPEHDDGVVEDIESFDSAEEALKKRDELDELLDCHFDFYVVQVERIG